MAKRATRLQVQKTYKLFVGGKSIRSESGRVATAASGGEVVANYARASRKDFRDAVTAGWTDKFSQIFSAVNPVASSHFNFTSPEPTGVVVALCPDEPPLLALVSLVAPVILSGNTAVVIVSPTKPLPALTFSEIIATSDLPGGVVNILSGDPAELAPHIAGHMDVNAIVDARGDAKVNLALQQGGGFNVKRYVQRDLAPSDWRKPATENPYWILDTVEMKTTWHPIGL